MIKEDNMYILTREELKQVSIKHFKIGEYIICGKYFINLSKNQITVNTRTDLRDIDHYKLPQYIFNFISS